MSSNTVNDIRTTIYFCEACKKEFSVIEEKRESPGIWLMTIKGLDGYKNETKSVAEFYKNNLGEIEINLKGDFFNNSHWAYIKANPSFAATNPLLVGDPVLKTKPTLTCHIYCDKVSRTFTVREIKMNPELTELALSNDALKCLHKEDNLFVINVDTAWAVLHDSGLWLTNQLSSTKKSGCYIATAVYGSYDCPEVWTLRRYRDNTLAKTWYGRAFIRTYYAVSPTLVKWFGNTAWFKKMWQGKLDRMVASLQEQGVESTPYEDKNW